MAVGPESDYVGREGGPRAEVWGAPPLSLLRGWDCEWCQGLFLRSWKLLMGSSFRLGEGRGGWGHVRSNVGSGKCDEGSAAEIHHVFGESRSGTSQSICSESQRCFLLKTQVKRRLRMPGLGHGQGGSGRSEKTETHTGPGNRGLPALSSPASFLLPLLSGGHEHPFPGAGRCAARRSGATEAL